MTDADGPTPAELLSMDELIDELKKRCVSMVLIRTTAAPNGEEGDDISTDTKGPFSSTIGLANIAKKQIERRFFKQDDEEGFL